jgi:N-acetylglutamate synthase-like GNAT family acetyltransferase
MKQNDFRFEEFTTKHLDDAVRLSRCAGWPHRRDDWASLLGLSRGVVATSLDQVVATALVTPFGPVAMANMIIVDQDLRGRGLGRAVMQRAMALITPEEWRLIATQEGLPLYETLGFQAVGSVLQCQGDAQATVAPSDGVRWARVADLTTIAQIDAAATGMQRERLLEYLAVHGRFAVLEVEGAVAGYAALRSFGRGKLAGPVIARDQAQAEDLLRFLFARCEGRFLRVDTAPGTHIAGFLALHGLACVADGIAMRRGEAAPSLPSQHRNFALAAQALG